MIEFQQQVSLFALFVVLFCFLFCPVFFCWFKANSVIIRDFDLNTFTFGLRIFGLFRNHFRSFLCFVLRYQCTIMYLVPLKLTYLYFYKFNIAFSFFGRKFRKQLQKKITRQNQKSIILCLKFSRLATHLNLLLILSLFLFFFLFRFWIAHSTCNFWLCAFFFSIFCDTKKNLPTRKTLTCALISINPKCMLSFSSPYIHRHIEPNVEINLKKIFFDFVINWLTLTWCDYSFLTIEKQNYDSKKTHTHTQNCPNTTVLLW